MKKYILYLAALMIAFASCSDSEEVDINYQANFRIQTDKVISSFKDYNDINYFHLKSNEKLRVTAFIYDTKGNIVSKNESLLDDYNQEFIFTEKMPEGEYTILAISSVVYNNKEDYYWKYEGTDNLSTFSLKQNLRNSDRATLGFTEKKITITKLKYEETISLSPATSLITVNFQYWVLSYLMHQDAIAKGDSKSPYYNAYDNEYKFWYYAYNTLSRSENNWESSNDELKINYKYIWTLDVDSEVEYYTENNEKFPQGTYDYYSLLPGELEYNCTYGQLMNNGNKSTDNQFLDGKGKMKAEKGGQYIMTIYCHLYAAEFKPYSENKSKEHQKYNCEEYYKTNIKYNHYIRRN